MEIKVNIKAEKCLKQMMKHTDCSYSSAILFMHEITKLKLRK